MIALLLGATLLAQTATVPPQQSPLTENRAPVRVNPPLNPLAAPSPLVDHWFAKAASDSSNAEIAFARLALVRGRADEVKSYARKMISEHLGLDRVLAPQLRRVFRMPLPTELSAPDALTYYRLQHSSDVDFDQIYILSQVAGHLLTLGAFQTESDHGSDLLLKRTVRAWTPTIGSHLQLAVDITQHIGGDSPIKTGAQ